MEEHTILVAVTVEAGTRKAAQDILMNVLPNPEAFPIVTSWWIAEDDRQDGSDNDSAVFIHKGHQGEASRRLYRWGNTSRWNVIDKDRR